MNDLESQWIQLPGLQYRWCSCIDFVDESTGWFVSDLGWIYKSTNGGFNWVLQNSNTDESFLWAYFFDINHGWVVGFDGIIVRTTNGGQTWIPQTYPDSLKFCSVFFADLQRGWIAGSYAILKTTNGGINWFTQATNIYWTMQSIYFLNLQTGWVVGYDGYALKTTNGGNDWLVMNVSSYYDDYYAVFFSSSQIGWITSGYGKIFKTTNGGINWFSQSIATSDTFHDICFINDLTGWIVGTHNKIMMTTNGGVNWLLQYSGGYQECLYAVDFINSQTGWAGGGNWESVSDGRMFKTTNGGITGFNKIGENIPAEFLLFQNYPNPFNPATKIKFEIPKTQFTSIKIFDILGREVTVLLNKQLQPGSYEIEWDASSYPSGVYFYKINTEGFTETKKMILLK